MLTEEDYSVSSSSEFIFCFVNSLKDVTNVEWNALSKDDDPFLCYEFLSALENNDCLGEQYGWYPHHLIVRDKLNNLVAATPLYIKTNSYGEFVFDWSWASAYEQASINYYPKIISSVPYTPVTGNRLLFSPKLSKSQINTLAASIIQATLEESEKLKMSGCHWLFNQAHECDYFSKQGLMFRMGCQFHWHNQNYDSFENFLGHLISRKRKKIKQERRYVSEQNIDLMRVHGNELNETQWRQIHELYESTFHRKSGIPTLSLSFFKEVGQTMGKQIMLVLAYKDNQLVACAINFCSAKKIIWAFLGLCSVIE